MKIFLSYASEDKQGAEEVQLALSGAGDEVFFDERSLPAAGDYHTRIRHAVQESELFVFLISPDSVKPGSYALSELEFAKLKWVHPKERVLTVMARPTPMDAIPTYLKAATLLEPKGNVAAETAAVVEKLKPGILGALPGAGSGIKLLKPRRQVAARLDDLIVRGTALLEDVNRSPATLPERLDQKSRDWDTWRGYAEQSIVELFSPPEPLQWLKEIKPRHLNFQKPPAQRAKELPRDIENELAFFRNLAGRLDNYPETTRR